MKKILDIFRIRREERVVSLLAFLLLLVLTVIFLCSYYQQFTPISGNSWQVFSRKFCVSGFDPITYQVITDWETRYNVYRHPLLAFMMFPPYLLNQALMAVTGINCAIFIVAAITLFCSLPM